MEQAMVTRTLVTACVLLVVGGAIGARADDPSRMTDGDEIQMQKCHEAVRDLRASGDEASLEDCIGTVADPCLDNEENQTTVGMVACASREAQWWDGQLNIVYGALRGNLSPEGSDALRDIQRAWIKYKDAKCAFPHAFFEGGTMAQPIAADCAMRMTAERAIEIGEWLDMGN